MQFLKKLLVAVGIAAVSTSAMSGNDIASKAAMAAQQAVETAKKVDGTVLDYSPNSLKSIDKIAKPQGQVLKSNIHAGGRYFLAKVAHGNPH